MGLFFNYDRPGPGVDKNAPEKKGILLFFELLGRNISKLILSNMLYFLVSLPIILLYYVIISISLGNILPEGVGSVGFTQVALILTLLIVILWGTGPVSCGYTYILRNAAREEHTFLASDFFEKSRQSFLHGLLFFVIDVVMLFVFSTAASTYWNLANKSGNVLYMVLFFVILLIVFMHTTMHFYLYETEVTFDGGLIEKYKNSFLLAFATMPMCLLILAIICIISYFLLIRLTPIAILVVGFVCWMSLMRFIVDFYTARVIKKNFISKIEETADDTNI